MPESGTSKYCILLVKLKTRFDPVQSATDVKPSPKRVAPAGHAMGTDALLFGQ
jgi:hypothetical protein